MRTWNHPRVAGQFSDVLAQAMLDGAAAAAKEAKAPISSSMRKSLKEYGDIIASMKEKMAALKAEVAMPDTPNGAAPTGPVSDAPAQAAKSILGTLTTSLGRVGGARFGMTFQPMITEQRKGNGLLAQIVRNTSGGKSAVPVIG
jgi:hypothetical protein